MKVIIKISVLLVLIISVLNVLGQDADEKKLYKKALKYYDSGDYNEAFKAYDELINANPKNFDYAFEIALIYFHELNKKGQSIEYFKKAESIMRKDSIPELYYMLGQAYQADGRYNEAIKSYHYYRDIDSSFIKVNTRRYVKACNFGIDHLNNPDLTIKVENLGEEINSKYSEFLGVHLSDFNKYLFTSSRHTNMFGENIEAIYISDCKNGTYSNITKASDDVVFRKFVIDNDEHGSVVNISSDNKTVILYSDGYLYLTEYKDHSWTDPVKMYESINFNFSTNHASLTADGSKIFFSSYGRKNTNNIDIFYSEKQQDGSWSVAKNIGSPVNTRKNEDSPEISPDGKTLYFASNGHLGLGGYDIYITELQDTIWSKPENIGCPVNSPWDDIYYKFDKKTKHGFVASDRKGGFGEMDIYKITTVSNSDD